MMNLEEYLSKREILEEENKNLVGVVLNDKEKKVDNLLNILKKEFNESCDNNIHYNMKVLKDLRIRNCRLYEFIKMMPKGSDLHVHGTALVPVHYLIDFLVKYEKVRIDINTYKLTFEINENTLSLKDALEKNILKREDIENKWTVKGFERGTNSWAQFEELFSYQGIIDEDEKLLRDYYLFAFRYYLSLNIFHVEIHLLLSKDLDNTKKTLEIIKSSYHEVKKEDERFSCAIIGTSMKMFETIEDTNKIFETVAKCQETIKDDFYKDDVSNFVIGVDLVNEEDKSRPLKEYASLLIDYKNKYPQMDYFLHCGESINAINDNLIDAYLLEAKRVGHGTNLYKYPNLLKQYADKEICLESCLLSNQVLDYVKDLRLHPSAEYLKRGVTIALCSDDPIYFEYETLVDDFFAAIICWNLGIAEVKHLCINSILYSGLDKNAKHRLMRSWLNKWNKFIDYYANK